MFHCITSLYDIVIGLCNVVFYEIVLCNNANNISKTLQEAVRAYEDQPSGTAVRAKTEFYVKHCMESFGVVQNDSSTMIPAKALKPGAPEAIRGVPNATCVNRHSAIAVQLGSPSRGTCPRTQMHLSHHCGCLG